MASKLGARDESGEGGGRSVSGDGVIRCILAWGGSEQGKSSKESVREHC